MSTPDPNDYTTDDTVQTALPFPPTSTSDALDGFGYLGTVPLPNIEEEQNAADAAVDDYIPTRQEWTELLYTTRRINDFLDQIEDFRKHLTPETAQKVRQVQTNPILSNVFGKMFGNNTPQQ